MYWWIGSAMRPRPSYVSAAPFMDRGYRLLRRPVQERPVDGTHRDDADGVLAVDRDLDGVAGLPAPHLLVELFLCPDADAVHADDAVALSEASAPRRTGLVETVDEHAVGVRARVQADPRPRPPARHASGGDDLVLDGQEYLEGDGHVHVRRLLAEAQRHDPDELTALVHHGAAPPGRHG